MKIFSVSNYYPKNYSANVKGKNFAGNNNNTTFNGWNVNVLELSGDTLKTVAKHFYKATEEELKEVTTERFLGIIRLKTKSLASYYKLKAAVDKAKLDAYSISSTIQTLENKASKDAADIDRIAALKKQLTEYEEAFENRKVKYYHDPIADGPDINDLVNQAKADGSWYYP